MITSIALENFKCFRKVEVNPRLITVFVGPNGSGKSSVLQAMMLLKQSAGKSELNLHGSLFNMGDEQHIHPYFGQDNRQISLALEGDYLLLPTPVHFGPTVHYSYQAKFFGRGLIEHSGEVSFTQEGQRRTAMAGAGGRVSTTQLVVREGVIELGVGKGIGHLWSITAFSSRNAKELKDLYEEILALPAKELDRLKFVPATRGLVRPHYPLGQATVGDISNVNGLSNQEEQTATNLGYSREKEAKLSGLLKTVTGVGLKAHIVPPNAVEVNTLTSVGEVNIVAEGFGTNALILLFLQLASAAKGATVMIEEPEIHLHPRAQATLASVLAEEAKAEDKQIIMTTHSEHILGRLLTLVAEKALSPDELAIYAFEKDEQGVCTAHELEVTQDGRVKGGIKDFFEVNLEEIDRYVKALQST